MKSLRESNVDTNTVGWYQTCSFDAFVSSSLVDAQLVYQSTIPNSIVLIVDTAMSAMSCPNVRAFQVRPDYQDALLQSCATAATDKFGLIFKELPVIVSLSILDKLLLLQDSSCSKSLIPSAMSSAAEQSRLTGALFNNVLECVDDSIAEVGKMQYSLRNIVKHAHGASNRMKKVGDACLVAMQHAHLRFASCRETSLAPTISTLSRPSAREPCLRSVTLSVKLSSLRSFSRLFAG